MPASSSSVRSAYSSSSELTASATTFNRRTMRPSPARRNFSKIDTGQRSLKRLRPMVGGFPTDLPPPPTHCTDTASEIGRYHPGYRGNIRLLTGTFAAGSADMEPIELTTGDGLVLRAWQPD